ncbi:MAG TPA: hypothetical protein VFB23_11890 [Candidatus Acidoferrales bacterium]|jgi:hypothetical protein|nr:hypothetical protein [Candidatus Acidoferrales bacterium]
MTKRNRIFVLIPILLLPFISRAQGVPNFSGSWKLAQVNPPVDPRNGRPPVAGGGLGGGGDAENAYGASIREIFAQAPQSMTIRQAANQISVQLGSEKESYTLDNKQTVDPPGDMNGLKTWAHWDGAKLHLHFKKGMNWGRDILSLSDGTLTVLRDVESGGGSTTFAITYSKTQ